MAETAAIQDASVETPSFEEKAPAVEAHGASFTYDGDTFVLQDVDIRIERGEFVAILGGNGSGKSTLAKHMNALLTPDEGRVVVLGRDTSDSEAVYAIRSRAGMVFQNYSRSIHRHFG